MQEQNQKAFLEQTSPGVKVCVLDLETSAQDGMVRMRTPEIELHCATCNGIRFFAYLGTAAYIGKREPSSSFLNYLCRNCRRATKAFAVSYRFDEKSGKWCVFKYGEDPSFGPPTPARAITLIGPDREEFLKGRRCENQGLGVGAFVY